MKAFSLCCLAALVCSAAGANHAATGGEDPADLFARMVSALAPLAGEWRFIRLSVALHCSQHPILAVGGGQAVVSGDLLANSLEKYPDVSKALQEYEMEASTELLRLCLTLQYSLSHE